ncbi:hypothetical protein HanRHA438_Chr10g0473771 [Helianthus annuus]|nr:hypothetical protein HanRHA438_Chr10g0473771 [Helianthus annuus]
MLIIKFYSLYNLNRRSSSSSYSVYSTNSKNKVGSVRCRQSYLYPVGIERLLPVRPPTR